MGFSIPTLNMGIVFGAVALLLVVVLGGWVEPRRRSTG